MDLQQLLNSITPEIYKQLQKAIEIGKWSDGRLLTDEQRALCMQAIIAYDQRKPEHERTGYIETKKTECAPKAAEKPLKWQS